MKKETSEKSLKKHHGRDDLIGEHKAGDAGQLVLLLIFLAVWITDSFILNMTTFPNHYINIWIRTLAGIATLIFSGWLAYSGLKIVFGEKRPKPEVITKGVFGMVRHPVYLSSVLLYAGMLFLSISVAATAVWIIIILFYLYISRYEEKMLTRHFGEEYLRYQREVPMMFPKLKIRNRNVE
ncbi:MAG: isoprenylcysteine carboxylmethyltransferase family protein [Bacteroidales bacterium]|nr:isoprenylcysteine carboxylmethyltransferase family protein [Bacteroidales bacterium]